MLYFLRSLVWFSSLSWIFYWKLAERCPTPCFGIATTLPVFIKKLQKLYPSANSKPPPPPSLIKKFWKCQPLRLLWPSPSLLDTECLNFLLLYLSHSLCRRGLHTDESQIKFSIIAKEFIISSSSFFSTLFRQLTNYNKLSQEYYEIWNGVCFKNTNVPNAKMYVGPYQTSMMELFMKIVND